MQPHVNWFAEFLLFIISLSSLTTQIVGLQASQGIPAHGAIVYPLDNILIYRAEGYEGLSYEESRNASLMVDNLDMYTTWSWQGEIVEQIHGIDPSVKVFLYRNMIVIKSFNPEWETALEGGWLLRDSEGNLIHSTIWPTHYLVDLVNQGYRDFMVTWLNEYFRLFGFDGVFADNCLKISVDQWCWDATGKPVNPRTGNLYTDEEIRDDTISFINYVKSRIDNKLWISNGIFEGQRFFKRQDDWKRVLIESSIDGFLSEGLFCWKEYYSEDKWKQSVDFVVWVQNNFLNQTEKIFRAHGQCKLEHLLVNCTQKQMATFVFSSLLLGVNKSQNYLSLQGAMLLDEVQNLFKIDLGVPKGDYYLIDGTHIYARDFTKAKVLVNPTDEPYSVNLNGDHETLEGKIVSSINIGSHTGVILKVIF